MPVYNGARTLSKTLESLQAQTRTDWECVVVDDGSTDNSYGLARAFGERDPRIWAYRLPFNCGAAIAINFAMRMVESGYVAVLAADDYLLEDFIEKTVAALDENPTSSGVYTDYIEWHEKEGIKKVHRCPNFDRGLLARRDFVNFSAFVARRPFLFDPDWNPVADWDALLRLTKDSPPLIHLPEILSVHRTHSAQVSAGLGGPRMVLKRLLLPYRYTGFWPATRAALNRLISATWWLARRHQSFK